MMKIDNMIKVKILCIQNCTAYLFCRVLRIKVIHIAEIVEDLVGFPQNKSHQKYCDKIVLFDYRHTTEYKVR